MTFWEDVKKDLQKGLDYVKEGAAAVKVKAGELTEEGKRQYKIYELKKKVQKWISELGGKVYELSSKVENPLQNPSVQMIISRIKKLEMQIAKMEGKAKTLQTKDKPKTTKKTVKRKTKKLIQ